MNNQPVDRAIHQLYTKAKGQTTVRKHYSILLFIFICHIYIFCLYIYKLYPLKKHLK